MYDIRPQGSHILVHPGGSQIYAMSRAQRESHGTARQGTYDPDPDARRTPYRPDMNRRVRRESLLANKDGVHARSQQGSVYTMRGDVCATQKIRKTDMHHTH
jgi:hypothetical protein